MANPERGEVEVVVNDRPYTLKMTVNAAVAMQKKLGGKTLPQVMVAAQLGDVEAIRCVVWAMLQKHHAKQFRTEDPVGDLLDDGGEVIMQAIHEVAELNKPDDPIATQGTGENPPEAPTADGTGEPSISMLAKSA